MLRDIDIQCVVFLKTCWAAHGSHVRLNYVVSTAACRMTCDVCIVLCDQEIIEWSEQYQC